MAEKGIPKSLREVLRRFVDIVDASSFSSVDDRRTMLHAEAHYLRGWLEIDFPKRIVTSRQAEELRLQNEAEDHRKESP